MEITKTLERQHRELRTLFARVAKKADGPVARRIVETITKNLNAHLEAEETVLYPAVARFMPEELVDFPLDHRDIRQALKPLEVDLFELDDQQMQKAVEKLRKVLESHISTEEERIFPAVRLKMSLLRRKDLDRNYIEDFEMRMKTIPFPFKQVAVKLRGELGTPDRRQG